MKVTNVEYLDPNLGSKIVRITYTYFFIFNVTKIFFFDDYLWRSIPGYDYDSKVRVQLESWKIQQRIANRKYL